MTKYHHTFFRWKGPADLNKLAEELRAKYEVIHHIYASGGSIDLVIHKEGREEIEIQSDNMVAFLSKLRAVLSQKTDKINENDVKLRDFIKLNYPHNRQTPLPFFINPEPELKITE